MALKTVGRVALALVLVLMVATAASAQSPKGEVAALYTVLNDPDLDENLPLGFAASFAGYVRPWLSLVGEVGGNYKTITEFGVDADLKIETALGGLRVGGRGTSTHFYVQVLTGGTRATAGVSAAGISVDDSQSFFTIQPGVGFDFRILRSIGLRIQGDYRAVQDGNEWLKEYRGAAGLVFSFGG